MKSTFKILLTLSCLFGLIYQFFETLDNYMQGKTVVNVVVYESRVEDTIPGITFCVNQFSFLALAKKYDDFRKLWIDHYSPNINITYLTKFGDIPNEIIEKAENITDRYDILLLRYYINDTKYHWISDIHDDLEYSPRDFKDNIPFANIMLTLEDDKYNDELEEYNYDHFPLYKFIGEPKVKSVSPISVH